MLGSVGSIWEVMGTRGMEGGPQGSIVGTQSKVREEETMGKFVKARRRVGWTDRPLITVRAQAFAFNVAFVKQADLEKLSNRRVSLHFDDEDRRIAFEFHGEEDPDSYGVTRDGGQGGKDNRGRSVQASAEIRSREWIRAVAAGKERRFEPQRDADRGWWVIQLCPAFEKKARNVDEIPSGANGLYRLVDGDEIVYIGQGAPIRSRVRNHERDGWAFDRSEFCVVEDANWRAEWESRWLDRYRDEKGGLPRYNRIGGRSAAKRG